MARDWSQTAANSRRQKRLLIISICCSLILVGIAVFLFVQEDIQEASIAMIGALAPLVLIGVGHLIARNVEH